MVSEYKKSCGYEVGGLEDFIYLIPYSADRFSYSIDNGDCKEVKMNDYAGVVRIDGFQASIKNTETLEGRFKYESEVSIYIRETLGKNLYDRLHYLNSNRWFVIVQDRKGNQFIQSLEFYSEFEYNISLTDQNNAQNRIQLRFKGSSNFPQMYVGSNIQKAMSTPLFTSDCRYLSGGAKDLKMCESGYVVIKETNHEINKIDVTGGHSFKDIDFIPKSFTYTQTYANGQYEDTITFAIPLDKYKYYWQNNLIEFKDNRYVATFRTANDNLYAIGYSEGASASYVIESSTAVTAVNKITITLKYIGTEGFYISSKDDSIFGIDTSIVLKPAPDTVNGVATKVCIGGGMANIVLIQRYTSSGAPINEYLALEGYADRFPTLNIVGIYSLSDDLGFPLTVDHPSCVGGLCDTRSGIVNPYNFSVHNTKYTFTFDTSCDYQFIGVPTWLSVTPMGGSFEMALTDDIPTENKSTTFYIETADGMRHPVIVSFTASTDTTGWDVSPREMFVSKDKQNVSVRVSGDAVLNNLKFESNSLTLVGRSNGMLIMSVPQNNTDNVVYHFATITNPANGESVVIKITQATATEDWRLADGYWCENGNKYARLELFINGVGTNTYKAGSLIEEGAVECDETLTRWVVFDTICDGVNEYELLKEQHSEDGELWYDTGAQARGKLIEINSEKCNPEHVKWQNSGEYICNNGYKCEVWEKWIDGENTHEQDARNCVYDPTDCPTEFPTKWMPSTQTRCVDRGNGICDSWFMDEQFISYDGGGSWESLGVFKVSDRMALKDDYDCNCPKHDRYRYERWVWDGVGFLCDDSAYDCMIAAIWVPYGFTYNKNTMSGTWDDKLITRIETPCDFNTKISDMNNFAKDCMQLKKCGNLDCSNVKTLYSTFENCSALEDMPLRNLGKVTNARYTFRNCSSLKGSYSVPMPNLVYAEQMFTGSSIEGWDFGGAKLRWKPENVIGGSKLKSLKGLDFYDVQEDDSYEMTWRSNYIETLEIKNIGIDFDFRGMPNLSKASIQYMYEKAKTNKQITWTYGSNNIAKWGSLPTGKSNIKWVRI